MAWYEAHQTLAKHPKTLKLSHLLKVERRYAVGLLHDLFSWGLDAAKKDGTLPGLGADEIAAALDYTGKKGDLVISALVKSGYLEVDGGVYRIHDWYDYAGKLSDRREDAKRRKDEWKERRLNTEGTQEERERNSSGTVPERGKNAPTVPNRTVPNITTTTAGSARTCEEPENDLGRVMDFYMDKVNPTPSPMAVDSIKAYTETLGADVVLHAMSIALDERHTGWSYIQAILQRYQRDGLTSMEAVLRSEQERQTEKEVKTAAAPKSKITTAENYKPPVKKIDFSLVDKI